MRAILVSVDYTDLLSLTLPYNRHHFEEVLVVTSIMDRRNVRPVADQNKADIYVTDSFYHDGARFNKWKALEEGLDYFGRQGLLCIMDADVLWPKTIPVDDSYFLKGKLYSPLRRMAPMPSASVPESTPFPPESDWWIYPIHRNTSEWAGYSQIFHADDPVLGKTPWHEINWTHAGGADSFFQQKWKLINRIRPPFEILHLGDAGANWFGRATRYIDGTQPENAELRRKEMKESIRRRGQSNPDHRYDHEKLG